MAIINPWEYELLFGGSITDPRWYWSLNGTSFASLTSPLEFSGDFYISGYFNLSSSGLHLFTGGSDSRIAITSDLRFLFRAGDSENNVSLDSGALVNSINYIEIYRESGSTSIKINNQDTYTITKANNMTFIVSSLFGNYGNSTSIPYFTGEAYDLYFSGITNQAYAELSIPLSEPFTAEHLIYDSNSNEIGTKYNDVADDYTQTEPS